jgi:ubiquinone/menaquinone biosynthesis C-methylase UbiE
MKYLLFIFIFPATAFGQIKRPVPFTYKEFHNLVYFFDSQKELMDFFNFQPGDIIANIGAGEGYHEGAFSLLYDHITFYSQDIDVKRLNQKNLNKTVKHYSKLRTTAQTNVFNFVIGTEKTTGLPNHTFDKILIISAFHEFTYVNEMLDDISKKLKIKGKLYIVDAFCGDKGHTNYTSEQVIAKLKEHGFVLEKLQGTDKHDSEGLYEAIFVKAN